LLLGQAVTSTIDKTTKPEEVFSIDLTAGQEVQFAFEPSLGGTLELLAPGAVSLDGEYESLWSASASVGTREVRTYVPAVSDRYYVVVHAWNTGETYTLSAEDVGNVSSLSGGEDIPGIPLELGQTVESTIDATTKPHEVFSVDLPVGQEVKFAFEPSLGGKLELLAPGATSVDGDYESLWSMSVSAGGREVKSYVPSVTGTYYLLVRPWTRGETYTLQVA
jgi:hypothetical protein